MPSSKRQRRIVDCEDPRDSSPQARFHRNETENSWAYLPATALRLILEMLTDAERFSAAQVCRGWYQGFRDPKLWKERTIEFPGLKDSRVSLADIFLFKPKYLISGARAIGFAKSFSTYLQDVDIIIQEATIQNYKDFSKLSKLLYQAKLNLIFMQLLDEGGENEYFIKSLVKLIQTQTNLKEFYISLPGFDRENGVELLKSLADVSGSTLQKLYLDEFYTFGIPLQRVRPITSELKKFYNLVYIKFRSQWLSDDLIKHWSQQCPSLAVIMLRHHSEEAPVVSNEAWQDLTRTHPELIVDLKGRSLTYLDKKQVHALLPPAIPLYELSWVQDCANTSESEITLFLRHLLCYHKTLTHLYVSFDLVTGYPDPSEVRSILSNFKKIKPFSFTNELLEDDHWQIETEQS